MTKDEIIAKWVEALRSDRYEQGRGFLCKNDKYCCLGVLCDLVLPDQSELDYNIRYWNSYDAFLPESLCELLDIDREGRILVDEYLETFINSQKLSRNGFSFTTIKGLHTNLSVLNDNSMPFKMIAEVIEHCIKNNLFIKESE